MTSTERARREAERMVRKMYHPDPELNDWFQDDVNALATELEPLFAENERLRAVVEAAPKALREWRGLCLFNGSPAIEVMDFFDKYRQFYFAIARLKEKP